MALMGWLPMYRTPWFSFNHTRNDFHDDFGNNRPNIAGKPKDKENFNV